MKHSSREEGDIAIIELNGKIMGDTEDIEVVDIIYKWADSGKNKVVLDLCKAEWMNSRGLGICISGATTLRNRGGDLKLACLSPKVKDLLDKTRMFGVFESFDSVDEAIKSFG
jgi:anti-sigma B factor antagonist